MTAAITLVTSLAARDYELGSDHPMRAVRAELSIKLADSLGVLTRPVWHTLEAEPAQPPDLALVHSDRYVGMVRASERLPAGILANVGLGTEDTPVFAGIHDAASGVVGATLAACRSVWSGDSVHAVNLVGGLHHAMPESASGFCVYNDVAVGIADLLRAGCSRIAYVDLDAHHGDGVEAVFRSDSRVLTISLHQDGRTIFPGTGSSSDIGSVGAEGSAVNLPLSMGTGDAGWLRGLSALVPVLLREFAPEIIVTQCGCDAHVRDPLTDLRVTVEGFTAAYTLMHRLAHELCGGRWVVLGGGGYDLGSAVPRSWTQLLAVSSGEALPAGTALPDGWRAEATLRSGQEAPLRLGDSTAPLVWQPWDAGDGDPDDPLDRAVAATRRAVLPLHGLDPFYDR
jgi:acetoin utilization protein AcuC